MGIKGLSESFHSKTQLGAGNVLHLFACRKEVLSAALRAMPADKWPKARDAYEFDQLFGILPT